MARNVSHEAEKTREALSLDLSRDKTEFKKDYKLKLFR